ncbi:transposase [Microvirga tunisiensis]|uniref:Transposase n=1 Tax=Microvirga tunisiensis TaxID=2108360 RepID=A0A5N7MVL4_9HYPH|nr:transposase [Microvirga tunisiensis]MPR31022.1 transposase [Microvirga tunisiensis]
MTDEEWERIRPILPQPGRRGRKPKDDLCKILNAVDIGVKLPRPAD